MESIDIEDVFPYIYKQNIELQNIPWSFGDLGNWNTDSGLILLVSLVKYLQPKKIFEFGTFKGRTTINLATNLPQDGIIYSIDLPDTLADDIPMSPLERNYMVEPIRRELFQGSLPDELQHKIVLIQEDSRKFNYGPFYNQMDIVFVDGGHTLEVVRSDSLNALKMVKLGGFVIWDDYGEHFPDVISFIDTLPDDSIFWDAKSNLVFYYSDGRLNENTIS